MKHLLFYFDPISPFAWLAFARLPQVLEGLSVEVEYRPVLFAGLLAHWGQKGPAEIQPKRAWTYRHVLWMAHHHGVPLEMPTSHPFNPLPLLRLALAAGPNRRVADAVFRHVWVGGQDAADPARLEALAAQLAPAGGELPRSPDSAEVKAELRANTDAAIAAGVFGVPTVTFEGRDFWGVDALPMLRDALQGGPWFAGSAWADAAVPRPGVVRRP
jgi:2-hydroxychromene-2-carboxylate isomerase